VGFFDQHKEESYCVYDISLFEAIKLAEKFNPYLVFFHGGKFLGYYEVAISQPILVRELSAEENIKKSLDLSYAN